jgi:hypothetical protein
MWISTVRFIYSEISNRYIEKNILQAKIITRGKFQMSVDRYTKFVLTIIAISLALIALRPLLSPTPAAAGMNGCGHDQQHPCYIAGWGPEGTIPIANSGHYPLKVLIGNPGARPVPVVIVNGPIPMSPQ